MRLRQAALEDGGPPAVWQSFAGLPGLEQELAEDASPGQNRGRLPVPGGSGRGPVLYDPGRERRATVGVAHRVMRRSAGQRRTRLRPRRGGRAIRGPDPDCCGLRDRSNRARRRAAAIHDAIVAACRAIGFRESCAKEGGVWAQCHRGADQFHGRIGLTELKPSDAQKMKGVGVERSRSRNDS